MEYPLCVDLDGTLIKSDLFYESFLILIKKNVLYAFLCIFWLIQGGRAYLKHQISARTTLNPALLPYVQPFLSFLKLEKSKGRTLVLVTASNQKLADQVAEYLGLFSYVFASDQISNMKGQRKKEFLNAKFGIRQYDYAGNDKADLAVWVDARAAILVNPARAVAKKFKKNTVAAQVFANKRVTLQEIAQLLRVHQYVKNTLVFFPLILGHFLNNVPAVISSVLAFIVFCLLASSAYLLNDLLDLDADRQHHSKKKRPFASGRISLSVGFVGAPLLFVLAVMIATYLPLPFLIVILCYYALTLLYSFYLKGQSLVDVFSLSTLYTLRIIAGITAIQSIFSPWLLSFSMFIFLSLALVKRYAELHALSLTDATAIKGRNYLISDMEQLRSFGTASGYLSVLVLALYINSDTVMSLYQTPLFLWVVCFIFLYWISRVWMLASRGQMHEDPILFAIQDKVSWIVGVVSILAIYLATGPFST